MDRMGADRGDKKTHLETPNGCRPIPNSAGTMQQRGGGLTQAQSSKNSRLARSSPKSWKVAFPHLIGQSPLWVAAPGEKVRTLVAEAYC